MKTPWTFGFLITIFKASLSASDNAPVTCGRSRARNLRIFFSQSIESQINWQTLPWLRVNFMMREGFIIDLTIALDVFVLSPLA
jgi:hypothetical protein